MQCPRCSQSLPAGSLTCQACGLLISSTMLEAAVQPPQTATSNTQQENGARPAYSSLVFQEFAGQEAQVLPPYMPYPPPPEPGRQPFYPQFATPGASVPISPQLHRSTMWKIVLTTLLVVILTVSGLCIALYNINSYVAASNQASKQAKINAATQLYQQVLSQPPSLQDSMTKSSSTWKIYEVGSYGCAMKSDGLHVHISFPGSIAICIDKGTHFTDFALQVDMHILSGGGGLIWRENSIETEFYDFLVKRDGSYSIDIRNFLQASILASGQTSAMSGKTNTINSLTVIAKGNKMYLYINQTFITLVQNSTFSAGGVAVVASAENGPSNVIYTNAKFWNVNA